GGLALLAVGEPFFERRKTARRRCVRRDIVHCLQKRLPGIGRKIRLDLAGVAEEFVAKAVVAEWRARQADDPRVRRGAALVVKVKEWGNELASRQVAGRAEDHNREHGVASCDAASGVIVYRRR